MAIVGSAGRRHAGVPGIFRPRDRIMHRRTGRPQQPTDTDQRPSQPPGFRGDDERYIAECLKQSGPAGHDKMGIDFEYEPNLVPNGLGRKGAGGLRPDFKVPYYGPGFYIEVTSDPERKLPRIRAAEALDYLLAILLIGPKELAGLRTGLYLLHELCEAKLVARALPFPGQA